MNSRQGPQGLHLFDRATGLNVLFDEAEFPRSDWSQAPRHMSIALTNACDLSCPYCYAPKFPARLSAAKVVEWASDLGQAGCFGIGFGGGEPTLHPDFARICSTVRTTTDLAISFTTHGHRLTEALAAELDGCVDFVRLSMDGVGETYEQLRQRPFADFGRAVRVAAGLAPFGINMVVNPITVADLDAAAEFAFGHGASELLLLPQVDGTSVIRDSGMLERLESWIRDNHTRYRLAISIDGSEALGDIPVLDTNSPTDPDHDFLHIDATGTLRRTAFEPAGVKIENSGVLVAIDQLRATDGTRERS